MKKYKNDIISRVPFTNEKHEITVQELLQAKFDLENYKYLYNTQIKKMINNQRGLQFIIIISALISFVSIIYYMIAKDNSITDIEYLTITMTVITFLVATFTIIFVLVIKNKRKHIPDKKLFVDIFMSKWHDFEWELKQKFTPKDTQKTSSWINVIGKFEVPYFRKIHYPEMVKFRYHSGVDSVKRAIFVAVGSTGSEPYAKSGQIYDLEQS